MNRQFSTIVSALLLATGISVHAQDSAMQGMGGMQGMPGMGGMSGMQGMPGMGGMSGMQGMPGMGGMSGMQGMQGMGGMQGMQGMGGMSPLAQQGAILFATPSKGGCPACHGKDAKTPLLPMYPRLAGQNKEYALQQMKDIKSGARNNGQTAAMKGVMQMVNDEEMAAIAEWISTLR